MKKTLVAHLAVIPLYVATGGIAIADDGWISIGVSEKLERRYDVKKGSFEITETKGNVPIAVVVGRITDPSNSSVLLYKWYVPLQACADEHGKVVSLNMSGEYQFENDFVIGGGNMSSAIGETICAVLAQYNRTVNDKGI